MRISLLLQFNHRQQNNKKKDKSAKRQAVIMDDHKWGYALEEAVKEVENEIHKKEHKQLKQQQQKLKKHKWGIVGRIFIRASGKKRNRKERQEEQEKTNNKDHQTNGDNQIHQNDQQHQQTTPIATTVTSPTTTTTSENNNDISSSVNSDRVSQLTTPDSPIIDLKRSCNSPIMSGNYPNRRRTTPRKTGVAERNETERKVVYKTLKNYNQINKLHDYDLV